MKYPSEKTMSKRNCVSLMTGAMYRVRKLAQLFATIDARANERYLPSIVSKI
jgi:hypothetical protein